MPGPGARGTDLLPRITPTTAGVLLVACCATVELAVGVMITGLYAGGAVVASVSADPRRTAGVGALGVAGAVLSLAWQPADREDEWLVRAVGATLLVALAVLAAAAGGRLRRRMEDQSQLARGVLATLASGLSGSTTVREVADRFADTVISELGARGVRIYVLDDDGVLRSLAWQPPDDPAVPDTYAEVPLAGPLPGAVAARERRALHLIDRAAMDAVMPGLGARYDRETSLHVLPLIRDSQVLGVLALTFDSGWRVGGTERVLLETVAQVLSGSLAAAREQQERVTRDERALLLAESHEVLEAVLDPAQVLTVAARLAVPGVADWCSVQLVEGSELRTAVVEHRDPEMVAWARELVATYPSTLEADIGAARVIRERRSELHTFLPDQLIVEAAQDDTHLEQLRGLRMTSALTVPLIDRDGTVLGAMTLVHAESARRFTEADVEFAEVFARQVVGRLQTARSFQEQAGRLAEVSRVAEAAQRAILAPPPDRLGGYRLAARYVSAAAEAHVGGDLYEAVQHGEAVRLLVGDVRGKGLGAVRTATVVLGEFRAAAADVEDLSEVPVLLDRRITAHLGPEDFVTAVVVELRPDGSFSMLTCGHPSPVVLRRSGEVEEVACAPSPPLGLGAAPTATSGRLEPGDRVLLFTDGLVEARTPDRGFVDTSEVLDAMEGSPFDRALDDALARLSSLIGQDLGDDLALLLAELSPR